MTNVERTIAACFEPAAARLRRWIYSEHRQFKQPYHFASRPIVASVKFAPPRSPTPATPKDVVSEYPPEQVRPGNAALPLLRLLQFLNTSAALPGSGCAGTTSARQPDARARTP